MALQVKFNKNKLHANILRSITKKLLTITDDQVSILRSYLYHWKDRFEEVCFKGDKKATLGLSTGEGQLPGKKKIMTELTNG